MSHKLKPVATYSEFGTDSASGAHAPEMRVLTALFIAGLISSKTMNADERTKFLSSITHCLELDESEITTKLSDGNFVEKSPAKIKSNQELLVKIYNSCVKVIEGHPESSLESAYPALPHIAEIFQLTETQKYILGLSYFAGASDKFFRTFEQMRDYNISHDDWHRFTRAMLPKIDADTDSKKNIEHDYERLVNLGLLTRVDPQEEDLCYVVGDNLRQLLLNKKISSRDHAIKILLGDRLEARYPLEDWAHIPEMIDFAKATTAASKGINDGLIALLYGPPGVGKTEAVRSLTTYTGKPVYSVSAESKGTDVPKAKPSELIARLKILIKLAPHIAGGAIIFVDDAEALMAHDDAAGKDTDDPTAKRFFNELFDEVNRSGQILVMAVNEERKILESLHSRSMQVEFRHPPIAQREKFFERQAKEKKLKFKKSQIKSLAKKYIAPPRMIDRSMALCSRLGGDFEKFCQILEKKADLEFGSRETILAPLPKPPPKYAWGLVNARDTNLSDIFKSMAHKNCEDQQVQLFTKSILFAGQGGTGKEAFAHHLAAELDSEIEILDGRDVILSSRGMGAPSPAMQLANAFRNAADYNRVLLINNIEDLAPSQNNPDRITPTYTETIADLMKQYKVRVVFTTKAAENTLDDKFYAHVPNVVQFDPLSEKQTMAALKSFGGFDEKEIAAKTAQQKIPDNLVASDFNVAMLAAGSASLDEYIVALDRAAHLRQRGLLEPERLTGFKQP